MNTKNKMIKILSVIFSTLLLCSNIAWSASNSYLRQQAALDRRPLDGLIPAATLGYDSKEDIPKGMLLEYIFRMEDEAAAAFIEGGNKFTWVVNSPVFENRLETCVHAVGEERVVIVYSLCAGRGDRFERSQIPVLVAKYGLEGELKKRLIATVGSENAVSAILENDDTKLNNMHYGVIGRELLRETGHEQEIMPKVLYANPITGKPFALGSKDASEGLGLPFIAVAGYKANMVMEAMGSDTTTFVFQPGFESTPFIKPGGWFLGTGIALAQFARVIPQDFKGTIFVAMGDTPFLDGEVIHKASSQYFDAKEEMRHVKGVCVMGEIYGDPRKSSYGRIVFREASTPEGQKYMILDRIVEVRDILKMIASSCMIRRRITALDLGRLKHVEKDVLIKRAWRDADFRRLCAELDAKLSKARIELPGENHYDAQRKVLRGEFNEILQRFGLLRKNYTGELVDGWSLIDSRFYNPAVYLFDHQTLRSLIYGLRNHNAAKEFYATDIPVLLEGHGDITLCVLLDNPLKVEGVNTMGDLKELHYRLRQSGITRASPARPSRALKAAVEAI